MKKNIMRKSLAVLVAFCMLLSMFPAASFAASFNDINSSHWAWQYVNDVVDRGLFQGTGSGTFEPETNMSRAMFVVALNNFDGLLDTGTDQNTDEGSDADDTADDQTADDQTADDADTNGDDAETPAPAPSTPSSTSFSDVPAGQWYTSAVAWASSNDIVAGLGDNTFGPNSNITREQMASLIVRYASYAGISLERSRSAESFSDSSSISSYASSAVTQCYQAGLINGMGDGTFAPQATATRAQVAVIISKLAALSRGESIIDEDDAESFTVRFDSNGGSAVESQTVKKGEKVEKPKNPTKTNFSFGGWYTDEELKNSYNFNTAVTSSFTLYAKWVTPGSGGGGGTTGGGTTYNVSFTGSNYKVLFTDPALALNNNNVLRVSSGTAVEFQIVPDAGYSVDSVTGAGAPTGKYYNVTVSSNIAVNVTTVENNVYGTYNGHTLAADTYGTLTHVYVPVADADIQSPTGGFELFVRGEFTNAEIEVAAASSSAIQTGTISATNGITTIPVTITDPTDLVLTDWPGVDIIVYEDATKTNVKYQISLYKSVIWNITIDGQGSVNVVDSRTGTPNDETRKATSIATTEVGPNTVTITPATGYKIEGEVTIGGIAPTSSVNGVQEFTISASSLTYDVDVTFIKDSDYEASVEDSSSNIYYYRTLAEAMAKAGSGDTVKLYKDVTLGATLVITDSITLDGNNKTITSTVDVASAPGTYNDAIVVQQASGTTIKDLTVTMNVTGTNWKGAYGIQVYESTGVELSNITVSGADAGIMLNAGTAPSTTVELQGQKIDVSNNKFGGIELNLNTHLTIANGVDLVNTSETSTQPTIWIDDFTFGLFPYYFITNNSSIDLFGTTIDQQHYLYLDGRLIPTIAIRPTGGGVGGSGVTPDQGFKYAKAYEDAGIEVSISGTDITITTDYVALGSYADAYTADLLKICPDGTNIDVGPVVGFLFNSPLGAASATLIETADYDETKVATDFSDVHQLFETDPGDQDHSSSSYAGDLIQYFRIAKTESPRPASPYVFEVHEDGSLNMTFIYFDATGAQMGKIDFTVTFIEEIN